ncbi:hypothetical protein QCC12_02660, partial [Pseudomonas aeruginosa]|nr:hypothetical protein [Pseudomonas aeruginosa]
MTAVRRIRAAALPDLPDASWSNALLVGEELVMSGMTAHPATRQAAARAPPPPPPPRPRGGGGGGFAGLAAAGGPGGRPEQLKKNGT